MNELAVIGSGEHAKVIRQIALAAAWGTVTLFDNFDQFCNFSTSNGVDEVNLKGQNFCFDGLIVGVGDNHIRRSIQQELIAKKLPLVSIVHPSAILLPPVSIDVGSVVMPGVIINSNVVVGKGCIINSGSIIEHDSVIEDYSHLCPGAVLAGGVVVKEGCFIGTGVCVRDHVTIGKNSFIGMGVRVLNDVHEGSRIK